MVDRGFTDTTDPARADKEELVVVFNAPARRDLPDTTAWALL
ncbi:hypothetical protein [Rhodococcus tukisamuensis]|uniref:Uncharacterized protein n=1 Tax=Rhodococcus tukisamuensis TaxID=168276 RepID=A0A1G7C3M8_9NOCA|nr:hypothetical protein [Rhodococcus tukisamuensis]SDE33899.1 hypothetical protein SAMN05444580_1153 [Rhodococcus tukisamuensis]